MADALLLNDRQTLIYKGQSESSQRQVGDSRHSKFDRNPTLYLHNYTNLYEHLSCAAGIPIAASTIVPASGAMTDLDAFESVV